MRSGAEASRAARFDGRREILARPWQGQEVHADRRWVAPRQLAEEELAEAAPEALAAHCNRQKVLTLK